MDTHFTQLRPDLTVHQADIFHTNTGILRIPEGYILVDPAFTQTDFERIATFTQPHAILAGFSTHAHYDHLFWSPLFGNETPRYCSKGTLEQIRHHRQKILNELLALNKDQFNVNCSYFSEHLSHLSPLFIGLHDLPNILVEVVAIPGHLDGQAAFLFPDFQTLFAADTLSNTEPPSIEGSEQSLRDYLETLDVLDKLIRRVDWIVPGHGDPAGPSEAQSRLNKDRLYLNGLRGLRIQDYVNGVQALALDFLKRTGETRATSKDAWQIHLENLRTVYHRLL
jgi:glyoxylase-like metal-dependent hydrolase (beta-lactamase superfamily II)